MKLTAAEIKDLAEMAGFTLEVFEGYDPEEEFTVEDCPAGGVRDDDGVPHIYAHLAWYSEYPGEGVMPLGAELPKPYNPDEDPGAGKAWPLGLDTGRMGVTPNSGKDTCEPLT